MSTSQVDSDQLEAERHTMARLLQSRDEPEAAAIVALSFYHPEFTDNWNGGQYEAVLEVPPELYDRARAEFADAISLAAEAMIGEAHYSGLNITVLTTPHHSGWVEEVASVLRARHVPSVRLDALQPAITG